MTSPFPLALALGLVLATGSAALADIGVIVLEPVSALGAPASEPRGVLQGADARRREHALTVMREGIHETPRVHS